MELKKRKPITVAYMRVSTINQSIDSQRAAIYTFANKHKIKIDQEVCCEAISAKMNEDARKITELKETLRAGDTLLVTSLDRLGRSIHQIVNFFNYLAEHEINFIVTSNESIKLVSGQDDFVTKILVAVFSILAEVEHKVLKDRIQAGIDCAKARGQKLGRKKGSTFPSKLDGKEAIVKAALDAGVPQTRIASDLSVSRTTLRHWIRSRKIMGKE